VILRLLLIVAALGIAGAGMSWAPESAQALDHSRCSYCHAVHAATGPSLTTNVSFNVLCISCHGLGTPDAPDALQHQYDGSSSNPYFSFGCKACHTTHSGLPNENYIAHAYVTNATWASNTATLTLDQDIGFAVDDWIWVDKVRTDAGGPLLVGYNGGYQVTAVNGLNVSYALTTDPDASVAQDGYLGGGIVAKGHAHSDTMAGGGLNIKLLGLNEDGTGIPKIQTKLAIYELEYSSFNNAPCTVGNTGVRVKTPPYSGGDGPPHTIMVGDRLTIVNVNPATFDGTYRVKEAFNGWYCYDSPTDPGSYASQDLKTPTPRDVNWSTGGVLTNGWVSSSGWHNRARVRNATGGGTTATYTIGRSDAVSESIVVDDVITVTGIDPDGYNGTYTVRAVTRVPDPPDDKIWQIDVDSTETAAYVSGGLIEYEASVKTITDATHSAALGEITFTLASDVSAIGATHNTTTTAGSAAKSGGQWEATITLAGNIGITSGAIITVSGVTPSGYNGTYTVTATAGPLPSWTVTYDVSGDPGTYTGNGTVTTPIVDQVTVSGIVSSGPGSYNGKWEVKSINTGAQTVTVGCPPLHRSDTLAQFVCDLTAAGWAPGTYDAGNSAGLMQSTGTLRPVIFESRGTEYNFSGIHSFAGADDDQDGRKEGPCEICHTVTGRHLNDNYGASHHLGQGCSEGCHPHGVGFDKAPYTTGDSPCPSVGCTPMP
jgi:predicted CXXCH cytochrome family protein